MPRCALHGEPRAPSRPTPSRSGFCGDTVYTNEDNMTRQIALTQALVLALTAPGGREAEADALVQRLAHAMPSNDIAEAQRQALAILDGMTV